MPSCAAPVSSGLHLVPAEPALAGAEIELVSFERREHRLAEALHPILARAAHPDIVLIDCPPSLGLLTLNAMVAAHAVLVPLQCEFLALEGLSHITTTIDRVRKSLNRALALHGIVLTCSIGVTIYRNSWRRMCADFSAIKSTRPSFRAMFACPKHPVTANPSSTMTRNPMAPAAYLRLAEEFLTREPLQSALRPLSGTTP